MKNLIVAIVLSVSAVAILPSSALAWYCSAQGTTGASGWGTSGNVSQAKAIALRECAVRTPRGARCLIMYCR
jgi:uncharacterized membrane protein